jgi:uncharacterized membrane protein YjjP (DUF1212 family)
MDDDQAREEISKFSYEAAETLTQLIEPDEGRSQLLFSVFGATAFAVLLFLLNAYVTAPKMITGICANALAVGLSFLRPTRFRYASAAAFFVGVIATVIAVYLLIEPFDDPAAKFFLVMSIAVVVVLTVAVMRAMAPTAKRGQALVYRLRHKPPKTLAGN